MDEKTNDEVVVTPEVTEEATPETTTEATPEVTEEAQQ